MPLESEVVQNMHANKSILDEIHDLTDCLHVDGSVHDFDQFDRESLSVLGQAVYDLIAEKQHVQRELFEIIEEFDAAFHNMNDVQFDSCIDRITALAKGNA